MNTSDWTWADIETHSIDERYSMSPRDYFRLGQWAVGNGPVQLTTNYDEFMAVVRSSKKIVFHNGHNFDLSVLFGLDSIEPLEMARADRVFDTLIHATLVNPCPSKYTLKGAAKPTTVTSMDQTRKWFGLDNQCHQLGIEGKTQDLGKLAKKYTTRQEPTYSTKTGKILKATKTVKIEGVCCGFGTDGILTDPEFLDYARQDVVAVRELARALLTLGPLDEYALRTQRVAGIKAQIHRNGLRPDMPMVDALIYEQDWDVAHTLNWLVDEFAFPITGKSPLRSDAGKAATLEALVSVGGKIEDLALTDNGAPSLGGDSVKAACALVGAPEAEALAEAVAQLAGTRTLPQLTKASTYPDGRVHPEYLDIQLSGRSSITKPGLTVFDDRHKAYFLADNDDELLIEFDLSNADPRAVAAMSGDRAYAVRFEPGNDGHTMNAIAVWGAEVVATDPKGFRHKAKIPGNGWNYGGRPKGLATQSGSTVEEMTLFCDRMNEAFPVLVRWQTWARDYARKHGYVINPWGRKMPVEKSRIWTQPPALLGQSFTKELIDDALLAMANAQIRTIKLLIHDAILASIPKRFIEAGRASFESKMRSVHHPRGGQEVEFPVKSGPAAERWSEALH